MNKKRVISLVLLTACVLSVMSGCAKRPDSSGTTGPISHLPDKLPENTRKYTAEILEDSKAQRFETLFHDENSEEHKLVESLQGNVTSIRPYDDEMAVNGNGKIYRMSKYETEFLFDIPEDAVDSIAFLKSISATPLVLHFYENNTLSLHGCDLEVRDFPFNRDTDSLINVKQDGEICVLSNQPDGYYLRTLSGDKKNPEDLKKLERISFSDPDLPAHPELRDFYITDSRQHAQQVYFVDTENKLYHALRSFNTSFTLDSKVYCDNTDRVFTDETLTINTLAPVYSKLDDPYSVYTVTRGSDNEEISVQLPDDHSTKDIKKIYGASKELFIEFTNGDFYRSNSFKNGSRSFKMNKLPNTSELLAQGKVKALVVLTTDDICVLKDDNTIYSIHIK